MRSRLPALCSVAFALLVARHALAQTPRDRSDTAIPPSAASKSASTTASRSSTARGPLPDPTILDGSSQPAEKKSDYGMLGEFEIPGDENVKGGKVGGQKRPQQQGQGQQPGGVQVQMPGVQIPGLPGMQGGGGAAGGQQGMPPMGLPSGSSGAGQQQGQQGGMQIPPAGQNGAGGAGGDQAAQPGVQPGGNAVDPNQANGQGGGRQVAGLQTDEANAGGAADANVQKPSAVGIGDPAMQIKGVSGAPGVVGGVVSAGSTQQMEKGVGGGKGGGSSGDNSNKGVEKGRVVPAGL